MKYFKYVKFLGAGVLAGLALAVVLLLRCDGGATSTPSAAAPKRSPFAADKYRAVAMETDAIPLGDRLNPRRKKSRAEEVLKGLPAGTEAFEITTPNGDGALVYRAADGGVFLPNDSAATVRAYRKAPPFAAFEIRPAAFAITDLNHIGGGVAIGIIRVSRFHAGPAATYDSSRTFGAGAAATYNLWRNVDLGAYAGKKIGKEGWRGGVTAAIAVP